MVMRWIGLLVALGGCGVGSVHHSTTTEATRPAPPAGSTPSPGSAASLAPPPAGSPAALASALPSAAPTQASAPPGPSLEQLEAEARKQLGDRVSFVRVRERYLLVSAPGWGVAGGKGSAAFVERTLEALFNGRFSRDIPRPIPVYLFGDAGAYNGFCRAQYGGDCISIYGFFSPSDYRLVMNLGLGIGTLSHELVHPILDSDFPAAPTWINEGIASLFEAPIMPKKGEIHGAKNWRYPRLSAAIHAPREKDKVSLPALFALSDEAFRDDDEPLHYAMARYFCQWMDGRGDLWKFYQTWRDSVRDDPRGEAAFRAVTGLSLREANEPWLRWVRGL
jgi:hypothetical protein